MKERMIKLTSTILLFSIILSIFGVPVYAISTSCVQNHFQNLIATGSGEERIIRTPPSENTCPYVAMSLLLTFYDTYWNEKFVEDNYEWEAGTYNSYTDTLVETFAPTLEADDWNQYIKKMDLTVEEDTYVYYPAYAMDKVGTYLEPYLISIGRNLEYHNTSDTTLGLTDEETVAVLESYLYNIRSFSREEVTVNYLHENDGNIVEKMREQIGKGFPVIYIGKRIINETEDGVDTTNDGKKTSGHELIAYGIEGDDILLHTGWSGSEHQKYSTTLYNTNRAIIWLEINKLNLSHNHSYKYVDSISGNALCTCQIYSTHPAHEDNHIFKDSYDSETHFDMCHCEEKRNIENHVITYSYYSPLQHTKRCSECLFSEREDHQYNIVSSSTENGHYMKCPCGAVSSTVEAHSDDRCEMKSTYSHNVYCKCGYLIREDYHNMGSINIRYEKCSDCEYIRDKTASGDIIKGIGDDTPHLTE